MQLPLIDRNGTPPETLYEQYRAAHQAMEAALDTLKRVVIHSRDYLDNKDATSAASDEHQARINVIFGIQQEMLEIAMSIDNQLRSRRGL